MPTQLTPDDFKQSLNAHVAARGGEIRAKFGANIGWNELQLILQDRACARYPCEILFGSHSLMEGEPANAEAKSERPEDGFTIILHPLFASDLEACVYLALYQLVVVNYGEFASPDDAETFGSEVLGLSKDEYYHRLCDLADRLAGDNACAETGDPPPAAAGPNPNAVKLPDHISELCLPPGSQKMVGNWQSACSCSADGEVNSLQRL